MMNEQLLRQQIQQQMMRQQIAQQAPPQAPQMGLGNRIRAGATKLNDGLQQGIGRMFPVDPAIAANMSPQQLQGMQRQSVMDMGMGILGASAQPGARLGGALAEGYFNAQKQGLGRQRMAYEIQHDASEDKRKDRAEAWDKEKFAANYNLDAQQADAIDAYRTSEVEISKAKAALDSAQFSQTMNLKERELAQKKAQDGLDAALKERNMKLSGLQSALGAANVASTPLTGEFVDPATGQPAPPPARGMSPAQAALIQQIQRTVAPPQAKAPAAQAPRTVSVDY